MAEGWLPEVVEFTGLEGGASALNGRLRRVCGGAVWRSEAPLPSGNHAWLQRDRAGAWLLNTGSADNAPRPSPYARVGLVASDSDDSESPLVVEGWATVNAAGFFAPSAAVCSMPEGEPGLPALCASDPLAAASSPQDELPMPHPLRMSASECTGLTNPDAVNRMRGALFRDFASREASQQRVAGCGGSCCGVSEGGHNLFRCEVAPRCVV
jgi:hypothetical protein